MARPKIKKKIKKHVFKDPTIEEIVEQEVEFICPVRGKIKQKVKIKRLKKLIVDNRTAIKATEDALDALDKEDDGLTIYNENEDLD